jgi:hypothetical protein
VRVVSNTKIINPLDSQKVFRSLDPSCLIDSFGVDALVDDDHHFIVTWWLHLDILLQQLFGSIDHIWSAMFD